MLILDKIPLMLVSYLTFMITPISIDAAVKPLVVHNFIEEAQSNAFWKIAFATGEHEQIVFMNISPQTNPNNEIGEEIHPFDQVILIVQGRGKALLNGKSSKVEEGDMIFIPKGTVHNVINMNSKKELKIISFYSDTDIPKGSVYKKRADEQKS
ncbi:MAG: cupin domain-containing protein [Chlamydiales bacterium]